MSTDISINVSVDRLKERAQGQVRAGRFALQRREQEVKAEAKGVEQRSAERRSKGLDPKTGEDPSPGPVAASRGPTSQSKGQRVDEEPGARRDTAPRGDFRYAIPVDSEAIWFDYINADPAYSAERAILPGDSFSFSKADLPPPPVESGSRYHPCGIIKVGVFQTCPYGYSTPAKFFQNRPQEFLAFMYTGGVVWLQNEHVSVSGPGCGLDFNALNSYIQANFPVSIRFGGGQHASYDLVNQESYEEFEPSRDRNYLAYFTTGFRAPEIFYTDLCSPILGGTPMYTNYDGPNTMTNPNGDSFVDVGPGVAVGFERVGRGFLVLSADSNQTANFPTLFYPPPAANFIDALKTLR